MKSVEAMKSEIEESGFNLLRFLEKQETSHRIAVEELRNERKVEHWMWYEFPQMKGLGVSKESWDYGIDSVEEAKAYLAHPVLASRLYELCAILMNHSQVSAMDIFGHPDVLKLRSSMTLFDYVEPNGIFADVLNAFYHGQRDELTLKLINRR